MAGGIAIASLSGCGDPEKLSGEEGRTLAKARERLDDAIDTEETLRTSSTEARGLLRRVRRIASDGSFEQNSNDSPSVPNPSRGRGRGRATLDEFGLAKLGELREVVPSLVVTDSQDVARALDRAATADFVRFAERDAARALLRPARKQVGVMVHTLGEADAGENTRIPVVDGSAESYLREVERDIKGIWPALARRLAAARKNL